MVQVHLEACMPDLRVAPAKMLGASQKSPARKSGNNAGEGVQKGGGKSFGRSRSVRAEASEDDVYEAEFGGPAERGGGGGSRASSRSKSRIAKDARAELLGVDDNVALSSRGLRSRSAARVREGVDIEMDVAEDGSAPKSRPASRVRGRKEKNDVQETMRDLEVRSVSASRTLTNEVDALETDGRLYTGRSLPSTPPRALSKVGTPRSSVRISREDEDSRASPDVPVGDELRSRRTLLDSLDPQDGALPEQRERVSYRVPRLSRENSDIPDDRLLRMERLTRKPGRTSRKPLGEATEMQVEPVVERAPRKNVRKADLDGPEEEEDGAGSYRRGRAARQPKRKAKDIPKDPAIMLPVSHPPECEMEDVLPLEPPHPPLLPSSPTTSSRSSRETSTYRIGWLHFLGDLIMWKDVPRSALWFGAGSFSILSASFMKEMQLGIVAISANLALCYLGVVFFYQTFLRRVPALSTGQTKSSLVTEDDLLGLIRFTLPAINLALKKAREVFSGDPATTLRVAIVLWLVTKVGAGISIWSFLRVGFFALFILPKCHSNYSAQLYAFGQSLLLRGWATWDSFSHKKATLIGGFLLAWNTSSYSSRLWGGFMLVVWLKLYQQSHPASFEKALADASGSSAIDRRESLQHTLTASRASQAAPVAEDSSSAHI